MIVGTGMFNLHIYELIELYSTMQASLNGKRDLIY